MSQINAPEYPVPVLQYDTASPPQYDWMARLICWFAISFGCVIFLNLLIKFVPNQYEVMRFWTDWPEGINGAVLAIFGFAGLHSLRPSRWGIILCLLLAVVGKVLATIASLGDHSQWDNYLLAYEVLWLIEFAIAPSLVTACLMRRPFKDYFSK